MTNVCYGCGMSMVMFAAIGEVAAFLVLMITGQAAKCVILGGTKM